MQIYKISVREKITDASGRLLDDDGLRALDSLNCFTVEVKSDLSLFDQLNERSTSSNVLTLIAAPEPTQSSLPNNSNTKRLPIREASSIA